MRIGILGSGIVGRVLAAAFANEGHQVGLGTRDTSKEDLVKFKDDNPAVTLDSFEKTSAAADIIVLAVKGDIVLEVIDQSGKENISGKVVIDATNPIAAKPPVNGVLSFFTGPDNSLMEQVQAHVPDSKIVKAFNSVGNAFMYKPDFGGVKPTMFICGNDDGAKKTVTEILDAFGWETEDMGKVEAARAIEPLCILWCIPGFLNNHWSHAFKLLKK